MKRIDIESLEDLEDIEYYGLGWKPKEVKVKRILDADETPEHGCFAIVDFWEVAEIESADDLGCCDTCSRSWLLDDIPHFHWHSIRDIHAAGLETFEYYDEEQAKEWDYDSVDDIEIQICPLCSRKIIKHKENKGGSN